MRLKWLGGGEYDNVFFFLPAASLCAEVVAEAGCGGGGGGGGGGWGL